jgi:hypothetical protein
MKFKCSSSARSWAKWQEEIEFRAIENEVGWGNWRGRSKVREWKRGLSFELGHPDSSEMSLGMFYEVRMRRLNTEFVNGSRTTRGACGFRKTFVFTLASRRSKFLQLPHHSPDH